MHNRLCIKNIFSNPENPQSGKVVKKLHGKYCIKLKENDLIETLKQFNRNCILLKYTFQDFDTSRKICTQFQVQEVTHVLGIHTFATDQISQIGIHPKCVVWGHSYSLSLKKEQIFCLLQSSILFVLLFSDLKGDFLIF